MKDAGGSARRFSPKSRPGEALALVLLVFVVLELGLRLPALPSWWEAGIYNGNLLSERVALLVESARNEHLNWSGYRGAEWVPERDPRPRLALLGDSRVFGLYVESEQTFASLLDRTTAWSAYNFGIPGASSYEAVDFVVEDVIDQSPDAAVVCYDINSSLLSYFDKKDSGRRGDYSIQFLRSFATFRWAELGWKVTTGDREPVMSVQDYRDDLSQLLRRLKEAGAERQVVFVGWTPLRDFEGLYTGERYELFRQASREVAQREGAQIVEMEEVLRGHSPDEVLTGMETIHLSVRGHRLVADALASVLGAP